MVDDTDTELHERIARLERTARRQASRLEELEEEGEDEIVSVGRRTLLKTVGLAGLVGYGGGRVSADPKGQVGTPEDPLRALYTESIRGGVTGDSDVSTLTGENLSIAEGSLEATDTHVTVSNSIRTVEEVQDVLFGENLDIFDDGEGTVTVDASASGSGGGTDTHTDVSDGGTTTVPDTSGINFGSNLTVSDDGDGSATVDATSASAWVDGSDNSNLLEPSEGSKTGVEDVTQIRSNDSVTVDIDANDGGTSASFGVRQDKDGTSATLFEVLEGGPIIFGENLQLTAGNQINYGSNAQDQTLVDLPVGTSPSAGTDHSYAMQINGTDFLTIYSENDGNGNLQNEAIKTNRKIDAQGGTVENTTGALTLSTGSGDVDLQSAGNIDVNSNRISNAKEIHSDSNNITFKGTADVNLDGSTLADKGGDMDIISTNSVNVDIDNDSNDSDGTRDFTVTKDGGATKLFTVNDGGDVDVHNGNLDVQGGTVENSTGDLILSSSGDVQVQPSTATNYTIEGAQTGSMDKDPTSTAPDGYIQIDVGGTTRQIPFYDAVSPS